MLRVISLILCSHTFPNNWSVTLRAYQTLLFIVVFFTVRKALVLKETACERFVARLAHETLRVPLFSKSISAFSLNWECALGTFRCESVKPVRTAVGLAVGALHNRNIIFIKVASTNGTGKVILVPMHAKRCQWFFHHRLPTRATRRSYGAPQTQPTDSESQGIEPTR